MKVITIARTSQEMKQILNAAKEEDVILRSAEGDDVLLSWIDDFDYELAAQRRNKELMSFLEKRIKQARQERGIPWKEAVGRLGLHPRCANDRPTNRIHIKKLTVSKRSRTLADLLAAARSHDVLLRTAAGEEYALTGIPGGNHQEAKRRLSELVMKYLDKLGEQGKLPSLEVVFVPRSFHGTKVSRHQAGSHSR